MPKVAREIDELYVMTTIGRLLKLLNAQQKQLVLDWVREKYKPEPEAAA